MFDKKLSILSYFDLKNRFLSLNKGYSEVYCPDKIWTKYSCTWSRQFFFGQDLCRTLSGQIYQDTFWTKHTRTKFSRTVSGRTKIWTGIGLSSLFFLFLQRLLQTDFNFLLWGLLNFLLNFFCLSFGERLWLEFFCKLRLKHKVSTFPLVLFLVNFLLWYR